MYESSGKSHPQRAKTQNPAHPAGVSNVSLKDEGGSQAADPAKRVRNLKKKLAQIQQLREKKAAGVTLESEQQAKIDSETSIVNELRSLGEEL